MSLIENQNTQAIHAWDANAEFRDERMGEGNDFFDILLWPAVEKLLKPKPGERLLQASSTVSPALRRFDCEGTETKKRKLGRKMLDRQHSRRLCRGDIDEAARRR
jgi:hypothetical protein